jgi:hypothetical protein
LAGSKTKGANITVFKAHEGPNEQFKLVRFSGDLYFIQNLNSGMVLDVDAQKRANNANVSQYTKRTTADNNQNQLWTITKDSVNGSYVIKSALSEGSLTYVLATTDTTAPSGSNIVIQEDKGSANQRFELLDFSELTSCSEPSRGTSTSITSGTFYRISPKSDTNLTLDIPQSSTANLVQPTLFTKTATYNQNQAFALTYEGTTASNGYYTLRAQHSAKALDVASSLHLPGATVIQYSLQGSSTSRNANQQWVIIDNADGTISLISRHSGLALDLSGNATTKRTLELDTYDPLANTQKFTLEALDESKDALCADTSSITPAASTSQRIDISGSGGAGASAIIYASTGNLNQKFFVEKRGANLYTFKTLHKGTYLSASGTSVSTATSISAASTWKAVRIFGGVRLQNTNTNTYLAVQNGNLTLTTTASGTAVAFTFSSVPVLAKDGYYFLQVKGTSLNLDLSGSSLKDGADILLYTNHKNNNQKFLITYLGGGNYSIKTAIPNKALDLWGGSTTSGTKVSQFPYSGTSNQLWQIVPADAGSFTVRSAKGSNLYLAARSGATSGSRLVVTDSPGSALAFTFAQTTYTPYYGTYVDVNITTQRLIFVKDNVLISDTPIITGNPNRGWATPTGTYRLMNKVRSTHLIAFDYNVYVDYWMPFTGQGHGLHDCTWRSEFGGNVYKTLGSHGCVNIPPKEARIIFENIAVGTQIRIHY